MEIRPELTSKVSTKATKDEFRAIYRLLKINAIPTKILDLEGVWEKINIEFFDKLVMRENKQMLILVMKKQG